jgi:hemerythrin
MSVGVAEFDEDHQRMLLLLQEIAAVLAAGDRTHARALTDNLLALAEDHTAREEAFLRRIGFPEVEMMIAAQQEGLSRIAALKDATPGEGTRSDRLHGGCPRRIPAARRY